MSRRDASSDQIPAKGVKTKLFGFTLVLLGVLDSLLFLRGGKDLSHIHIVLIALGLLIWVMGTVRQRTNNADHGEN